MIDKGLSALVFDCSTLLYWNRPPVGIIRIQLEIAQFLLQSPYKVYFVAFKKNRLEMIKIPKSHVETKIESLIYHKKNEHKIQTVPKNFKTILYKLKNMNKLAEEILIKINKKNKKTHHTVTEQLLALKLPPLPKKTKDIFNKETLFISIGLDWDYSNYSLIYRLKQEIGFQFVGMFFDCLIIDNPQWAVSEETLEKFSLYMYYLIYMSDKIAVISECSLKALLGFMQKYDMESKAHIKALPLANEISLEHENTIKQNAHPAEQKSLLPIPSIATIFLKNDPKTGELVSTDDMQTDSKPLLSFKRPHKADYILYVSTLEPRKNHILLLNVWKILQEKIPNNVPDLVLVGMKGWGMQAFWKDYQEHELLRKNIHCYDDVNDDELDVLYKNCLFSVFPSFAEGFGLAAAESLYYNKPVLISHAPALIEATQNLMPSLDPYQEEQWAEMIIKWITSPYEVEQLAIKIQNNFKKYSWKQFADNFMAFCLAKNTEE